MVEAVQVCLADQPAVGVDRGRTARPQFSATDRVAHLAALAQAVPLIRNGNGGREIVVDRRDVDFGRGESGLFPQRPGNMLCILGMD